MSRVTGGRPNTHPTREGFASYNAMYALEVARAVHNDPGQSPFGAASHGMLDVLPLEFTFSVRHGDIVGSATPHVMSSMTHWTGAYNKQDAYSRYNQLVSRQVGLKPAEAELVLADELLSQIVIHGQAYEQASFQIQSAGGRGRGLGVQFGGKCGFPVLRKDMYAGQKVQLSFITPTELAKLHPDYFRRHGLKEGKVILVAEGCSLSSWVASWQRLFRIYSSRPRLLTEPLDTYRARSLAQVAAVEGISTTCAAIGLIMTQKLLEYLDLGIAPLARGDWGDQAHLRPVNPGVNGNNLVASPSTDTALYGDFVSKFCYVTQTGEKGFATEGQAISAADTLGNLRAMAAGAHRLLRGPEWFVLFHEMLNTINPVSPSSDPDCRNGGLYAGKMAEYREGDADSLELFEAACDLLDDVRLSFTMPENAIGSSVTVGWRADGIPLGAYKDGDGPVQPNPRSAYGQVLLAQMIAHDRNLALHGSLYAAETTNTIGYCAKSTARGGLADIFLTSPGAIDISVPQLVK